MIISGAVQKKAWDERTFPPVEKVREGVWSVPIGFTGSPIRYTFCYLLLGTDGSVVVVDPGWDSAEGREQFTAGLAAAGRSMADVTGIVVTHLHPDHLGMVRWLAEETSAWVGMHPDEISALDQRPDFDGLGVLERTWLAQAGTPEDELKAIMIGDETYRFMMRFALADRALAHGDRIELAGRDIRVAFTPGHTAGHICLVDLDRELVFSGDHILPRVSPNVGLSLLGSYRTALGDYLDSLDLMLSWDGFEVCPGHEYRFIGLGERSMALREHHRERSEELLAVAEATPGLSLWQVAEQLTWSRGWASLNPQNQRAALAETAAHLEHLVSQGRATWSAVPGELALAINRI